MIIYLYGPDSYRRREKLKEIVVKYQEKHSGLTIGRFDFSEYGDWEDFKDFIKNQSLFSVGGKKLAICRPAGGDSIDEEFTRALKLLVEDKNISVIIDADSALSNPFNFLLRKPVLSQVFDELKPQMMAAFIKKEAERRGFKIIPQTVNNLLRRYGFNTWAIVTELDKLALGGLSDHDPAAPHFFVLLNRAKRGDLTAMNWLLETEEPAIIFNIFASQAEPDLKIKLADYDAAIKSGKLDYEEALLDLAI